MGYDLGIVNPGSAGKQIKMTPQGLIPPVKPVKKTKGSITDISMSSDLDGAGNRVANSPAAGATGWLAKNIGVGAALPITAISDVGAKVLNTGNQLLGGDANYFDAGATDRMTNFATTGVYAPSGDKLSTSYGPESVRGTQGGDKAPVDSNAPPLPIYQIPANFNAMQAQLVTDQGGAPVTDPAAGATVSAQGKFFVAGKPNGAASGGGIADPRLAPGASVLDASGKATGGFAISEPNRLAEVARQDAEQKQSIATLQRMNANSDVDTWRTKLAQATTKEEQDQAKLGLASAQAGLAGVLGHQDTSEKNRVAAITAIPHANLMTAQAGLAKAQAENVPDKNLVAEENRKARVEAAIVKGIADFEKSTPNATEQERADFGTRLRAGLEGGQYVPGIAAVPESGSLWWKKPAVPAVPAKNISKKVPPAAVAEYNQALAKAKGDATKIAAIDARFNQLYGGVQ